MAAPPLFDFSNIDISRVMIDLEGIKEILSQRGESLQLDYFAYVDEKFSRCVAVRKVRPDEWWVPGHIPGTPVLPAVMMVESAAQATSFLFQSKKLVNYHFVGFTGIDNTKFRRTVGPGDTLVLIGQEVKFSVKRMVCDVQGYVNGSLVFETQITGMPVVKSK